MRFICSLFVLLLLSGCVATYKQNTLAVPSGKLITGKSVIIATPTNGFYGAEEYFASGRMTATAVRSAFVRHTNSTTISTNCDNLDCFKTLDNAKADYYVIPEILHWEDRATEWSGKSDKIEIKISVYEAQSWRELASASISGKSKWGTFGGDHPQDLLPEPLNKYIESLY